MITGMVAGYGGLTVHKCGRVLGQVQRRGHIDPAILIRFSNDLVAVAIAVPNACEVNGALVMILERNCSRQDAHKQAGSGIELSIMAGDIPAILITPCRPSLVSIFTLWGSKSKRWPWTAVAASVFISGWRNRLPKSAALNTRRALPVGVLAKAICCVARAFPMSIRVSPRLTCAGKADGAG